MGDFTVVLLAHHDLSTGDGAHASGMAGLDLTDYTGLLIPAIAVVITLWMAAAVMARKLPLSALLFRSLAGQKVIDEAADKALANNALLFTDSTASTDGTDSTDDDTVQAASTWLDLMPDDLYSEPDGT